MVCYDFISEFKFWTNPGLSQSIFDQPGSLGWDGVQDQYGIIVLITLSYKPSAVVRCGKLLRSIKYNISVYFKLWQAKECLLAFSLSSVILVIKINCYVFNPCENIWFFLSYFPVCILWKEQTLYSIWCCERRYAQVLWWSGLEIQTVCWWAN